MWGVWREIQLNFALGQAGVKFVGMRATTPPPLGRGKSGFYCRCCLPSNIPWPLSRLFTLEKKKKNIMKPLFGPKTSIFARRLANRRDQ